MIYFANPCGNAAILAQMHAGVLGYIDTPLQRNTRPEGVIWCADNGCFSDRWDEARWWTWLQEHAHAATTCRFAVAPDVVGDADATAVRAAPWLPRIRDLGYPVAYVAQDGITEPPWDDLNVLFLGGTTAWKLGPEARRVTAAAVARGIPVHCGRVNSERRFEYARAIGCSSADGTFLTYGPDVNLPRLLSWTRNLGQDPLF